MHPLAAEEVAASSSSAAIQHGHLRQRSLTAAQQLKQSYQATSSSMGVPGGMGWTSQSSFDDTTIIMDHYSPSGRSFAGSGLAKKKSIGGALSKSKYGTLPDEQDFQAFEKEAYTPERDDALHDPGPEGPRSGYSRYVMETNEFRGGGMDFKGFLNIAMLIVLVLGIVGVFAVRYSGLRGRSAMIQSWNKLCFTGGRVEVAVSLPGNNNVSGFWPAVWAMGNLGRAGYGASLDGTWPYAYDACDIGTLKNQTDPLTGGPACVTTEGDQYNGNSMSYLPGQRLSRCTCAGESHPGPQFANGTFKGRSASEIDFFEATASATIGGQLSQSYQLAPMNPHYYLVNASTENVEVIDTAHDTAMNTYLGGAWQQAASGLSNTNASCYNSTTDFAVYGIEYQPSYFKGTGTGKIYWLNEDEPMWKLSDTALVANEVANISQRDITGEPMSIIMNLGMSTSFTTVLYDELTYPGKMRIDYIRIYQEEDQINVGCSPEEYPTADYIVESAMETPSTHNQVVIIGSGPAVLSWDAIAGGVGALRFRLKSTLFVVALKIANHVILLPGAQGMLANGFAAGGQLTTTTDVENFPGFPDGIRGPEMMDLFRAQSIRFGTVIHTETISKIDLSSRPFKYWREGAEDVPPETADTVIIATGASARRLYLPGEDTYWQSGISACAVCDGAVPIFRNKPLAVIGGGDSACEEGMYLTKYASHVFVLVRRDVLRASKVMAKRLLSHPKVTVLWNSEPIEAKGDGDLLNAIAVRDTKTGEVKDLPVNGLFYAIGHEPATSLIKGQVAVDSDGYVITEPGTSLTSVKGVFAAGDVQDKKYRQAITSAGTGCIAALEAERLLAEEEEH
ncbi:beta-glucan synthesis-associated protein KRE6, partial [Phenoliferia sp. Uapishka_3]